VLLDRAIVFPSSFSGLQRDTRKAYPNQEILLFLACSFPEIMVPQTHFCPPEASRFLFPKRDPKSVIKGVRVQAYRRAGVQEADTEHTTKSHK